jgi:hypothetical protein
MHQVVKVILDYSQEVTAHTVGLDRVASIRAVADHPNRAMRNLNFHEYVSEMSESVGAEIAVAEYFGIKNFVPTNRTYKTQADVGATVEVKYTRYTDGSLIIGKTDRQDDVGVLVVGRSPVYYIIGWIPVAMAKRTKYHRSDGSHWVGQNDLFPIKDLKRSIYGSADL